MSSDEGSGRKDLEEGLRFLHIMGMQTKHDVFEASVRVFALIEELLARGQIDLRSLEQRSERLKERENERMQKLAHVNVGPAVDKYALKDLPQIDCDARIPLCKGRCCKLTFALSFQDLDEGVVKWEYNRPYHIRHREADGYCVHSHEETRGCTVYTKRPSICRTYDCRNDKRIWIDFDKRIPAPDEAWPQKAMPVTPPGTPTPTTPPTTRS
jgi:hypothetical protein